MRASICVFLVVSVGTISTAIATRKCCRNKAELSYDHSLYETGDEDPKYKVAYAASQHRALSAPYLDDHHDAEHHHEDDDHGHRHHGGDGHGPGHDDGDSFSFFSFKGPVSGPVREVSVPPPGADYNPNAKHVDYQAQPDYAYHYGVHDPKSDNSHTHHEKRSGSAVQGEYRVMQPDGMVRIVKYTSDPKSGFKATVEYALV